MKIQPTTPYLSPSHNGPTQTVVHIQGLVFWIITLSVAVPQACDCTGIDLKVRTIEKCLMLNSMPCWEIFQPIKSPYSFDRLEDEVLYFRFQLTEFVGCETSASSGRKKTRISFKCFIPGIYFNFFHSSPFFSINSPIVSYDLS